ncbi:MAG: integrin alpha [Planctomycetaceae bacterium]
MGDLDHDGNPDIAVGANGDDDGGNNQGAVYVLFLNSNGTVKGQQKISELAGNFTGSLDGFDEFGFSVAGLGDLDGKRGHRFGRQFGLMMTAGGNTGAFYVLFLNADGTVLSHQEDQRHDRQSDDESRRWRSVWRIAGRASEISTATVSWRSPIRATRDDDGGTCFDGAVYILSLEQVTPPGVVTSEQKISDTAGGFNGSLDDFDIFGSAVSAIGDLDGDGVNDVVVGALADDDGGTNVGAVYVLFLNADGTVKSHQKISSTAGNFTGAIGNYDSFGISLANLGDLDGDGITDLAVGAFPG